VDGEVSNVSSVLRGFGVVAFDIISMMFEAEKDSLLAPL
jgi:hypothetical protein